jgi:hypothetical protein
MRFPVLLSGIVALLLATVCRAAPDEKEAPAPDPDAQYRLAIKAYRGELSAEQLADLERSDPGPSLYLDSDRASEKALVRLVATLPDEAHARLRRDGLLKWKVSALPDAQRAWVGDLAAFLEGLGEGPFPVAGRKPDKRPAKAKPLELKEKADPSATETGFIRVDLPGQEEPSYSWWIWAPGAKRAAWLTVVHAVGLATQEWSVAHRLRLEETRDQPDSPPVPSDQWLKFRETKRTEKPTAKTPLPELPRLFDDAVYEAAQKVYRGRVGVGDLAALKTTDPNLETRLKTKDPLAQAAYTMFSRLTDDEHRKLRTEGVLRWYSQELSKERIRLLEPAIEELNRRGAQAGEGEFTYSLAKFSGTCVGFAILDVPGAEGPVLSWWVRSRRALNPTWVTLINTAAAKNPAYYRVHLVAIGAVQ